MGKIKLFFAALLAVSFVGLAAGPAVHATTYQDASDASTDLYYAAQTLVSEMQSASAADDIAAMKSAVADFQKSAAEAKDAFAKVANDARDAKAKEYVMRFSAAADTMSTSSAAMISALETEDQNALQESVTSFQNAANEYDNATLAYQNYVKQHPEQSGDSLLTFYLVLFIVACVLLVLALAFMIAMRDKHSDPKGKLKAQRNQLVIGALIAAIGSGVTYFWYRNAIQSDADEYYVMYGPMIIGYILFIIGIVNYITTYLKLKKAGDLGKTQADKNAKIVDVKPETAKDSKPITK